MTQLQDRLPIWRALSAFYLDTELQSKDYDFIFTALKESGKPLSELKAIDLYEVFPTLQLNLNSVAGEWAGFDEAWLVKECTNNFKRRNNKLFRFLNRIRNHTAFRMRKKHWKEMERRFETWIDTAN